MEELEAALNRAQKLLMTIDTSVSSPTPDSANDKDELARWFLIDLNKVRECGILDDPAPINPNGDGTAGKYIPIDILRQKDCVIIDYHEQIAAYG